MRPNTAGVVSSRPLARKHKTRRPLLGLEIWGDYGERWGEMGRDSASRPRYSHCSRGTAPERKYLLVPYLQGTESSVGSAPRVVR